MGNSQSRLKKKSSSKKRKIKNIVLISLMALTSAIIFFAINLSWEAKHANNKMFVPLEKDLKDTSIKNELVAKADDSPFTILLTGVERGKTEKYGRSDMLIVATVNPSTNKISMVSIPRDTLVHIEGLDREDKINHAYANGGIDWVSEAIETMLGIPIDYYVSTDFQGFQDIVDTIGGVEVNVPFTFKIQLANFEWKTFTEGPMFLEGDEALAYVRMRKKDPEGDKGRNERQQQVIESLLNKMTNVGMITKIDDLIEDVGDNVKTNIPSSDYLKLAKMYQKFKNSPIEHLQLDGSGKMIYSKEAGLDLWYFVPEEDSLSKVGEQLKSNLVSTTYKADVEEVKDLSIGK
ncbi:MULTISPECIES: LCP family protein [unclassified Psychrobacillus]|uniref:LCP family protein n=1 Tax=unclassified Psychrobacillus TaxID=2636677 RepID=UPI001F0DFAC0|nr:LCP family protein [Psychrobacillus sp. BL-248-WT-3]